MIDHYYVGRSEYVELRLRELRAQALNDRLVREARGPRPLRRRLGRLLIAVGTALQGQPLEALVSESALMVSDDLCNRAPA